MKKYPRLALLLTALLVTVCRCSTGQYEMVKLSAGASLTCEEHFEIDNGSAGYVYECALPCPGGSFSQIDFSQQQVDLQLTSTTLEKLQEKYCEIPNPVTAPRTATPTPTSTPTGTSAPQKLTIPPLLTTKVTNCDLKAGYINFELAGSAPDLKDNSLVVKLGGTEVHCEIPSSNKSVLSCVLPLELTFPADVQVSINGTEVNNFTYDGSGCNIHDPEDEPEEEPAPPPISTP